MNMYYPTSPGTAQPMPQPTSGHTIPYVPDPAQPQQFVRMPYITPPPQPQQLAVLPGRAINNPDEVTPNEVPNDGRFGIFPMADNSAIYLKGWTSDGRIQTIKYVQAVETEVATRPQNMANLSDEIAQIKDALADIQSQLRNRKQHYYDSKQKKGEINNG